MRAQTAFERFSEANQHGLFVIFLVVLRVAIGIEFLSAGIAKMTSDWSAAGFLEHATGPFASLFQAMAGSQLVDLLNIWGLTLIGIALIFGILVRPAAVFGIILMNLYYWAGFEANTAHGFIDAHIILICALAVLASGGAGHVFGLNGFIQEYLRKKNAFVRALFG